MADSSYEAIVFKLEKFEDHPNADKLKLIRIPDSDYVYCCNYEQWADHLGKNVAWICPDTLAPVSNPEFAFLAMDAKYTKDGDTPGNYVRVKAKRLRGVLSYGLLVKAPEWAQVGDNLWEYFNLGHYNPDTAPANQKNANAKLGLISGEVAPPPQGIEVPYYDIENFMKYGRKTFIQDEEVLVFEKLEGQNIASVYHEDAFHVKSRNEWKREFNTAPKITLEQLIERMGDEEAAKLVYERNVLGFKSKKSIFWQALQNEPELMEFLRANPKVVAFGEQIGNCKGYVYDTQGKPRIRVFDLLVNGKFMDYDEAFNLTKPFGVRWVPEIYRGPFSVEKVIELNETVKPFAGNHISEGICVRPVKERWDHKLGRVILKLKTPAYMEK